MKSSTAVVVGAGIAGLSVAQRLASRGVSVLVLERESSPAFHASGNVAGILSPYILSKHDRSGEYLGSAFAFTIEWLKALAAAGIADVFTQTGIVQLPATRRISRMISEAQAGTLTHPELSVLTASEGTEASGVKLDAPALWYARGGWVRPKALCEGLAAACNIRVHLNRTALGIIKNGSGWDVVTREGESFCGDFVVIANAYECAQLELTKWLPVEAVRGIIATAKPIALTKNLRSVVCHNGYLIPLSPTAQALGTTYRHGVFHRNRDDAEETELKGSLAKWLPGADPLLDDVRVCFRTSTADRLPYVGRLWAESGELLSGVFISIGHGSRGIVSAPFAAELIAQGACGENYDPIGDIVAVNRVRAR